MRENSRMFESLLGFTYHPHNQSYPTPDKLEGLLVPTIETVRIVKVLGSKRRIPRLAAQHLPFCNKCPYQNNLVRCPAMETRININLWTEDAGIPPSRIYISASLPINAGANDEIPLRPNKDAPCQSTQENVQLRVSYT